MELCYYRIYSLLETIDLLRIPADSEINKHPEDLAKDYIMGESYKVESLTKEQYDEYRKDWIV